MAAIGSDPYLQDDPDALAAGPQFDPNALGAGAPPAPVSMPAAPDAPPDPTVLSPLGQVPQSAIPGPPPSPIPPSQAPPPPATGAGPAGDFPGLVEPGNIDLAKRPQVKNPDGSVSTVRSASFNIDGKEVLIPTVSDDGRLLTDDQAVAQYMATGKHLGKFDNPDNATRYAQALHEQQAKFYGLNGPAAAAGAAPALPPLGAPPPLPTLTGDPAKDTQANLEWNRQSTAWHQQALAHQAVIDTKKATVQAHQSDLEAVEAKKASDERDRQTIAQNARREANQKAIDQSVQERMAAQRDLEHKDPMTGGKIVALIAGALGAARQDMASAQMGHPTVHPNAALEVINAMSQQEYERKKNRLANASDALLQARYGYKDSEDNHRAALNDLDADTSAHYKLIAKEAESQLRQAGAGAADIAANEVVNGANQEAMKYENGIHEREEKQATERQHYAAEEALTGEHLGLEKEQIKATIASRRDNLEDKRVARRDRDEQRRLDREAREAAAKDKKTKDLDSLTLNDPKTGLPMSRVASARIKDKVASDVAAVEHYDEITHKLADHIDKYGTLSNPLSKEYKDRESLVAQVKAAGAAMPNSGIQSNEKGAAMEEAVVGAPGLTFGQGHGKKADTAMLRSLAEGRTEAAAQRLRMELTPLEGDKTPRLPEFIHTPPKDITLGGKSHYEMGADGNYHLVKGK